MSLVFVKSISILAANIHLCGKNKDNVVIYGTKHGMIWHRADSEQEKKKKTSESNRIKAKDDGE